MLCREDLENPIEEMYPIKDSGERREYETGAVRDRATGKGRYDLLPMFALMALAKHFEAGCQKYGDRNWEKGIPISNYCDSAMRHLTKFMLGMEDEPHLTAAAWNIMCAIDTYFRIELGILPGALDDLSYPILESDDDLSEISNP